MTTKSASKFVPFYVIRCGWKISCLQDKVVCRLVKVSVCGRMSQKAIDKMFSEVWTQPAPYKTRKQAEKWIETLEQFFLPHTNGFKLDK